MALDRFQEQVAAIVLSAADGHAFALAGAGALSVHGLIDRPTEDVDLFSPQAGGVGQAMPAVLQALEQHGYRTHVRRAPEDHGGDFAQLVVQRGDDSVSVDMARDWRQHDVVRLHLGPVLHRDDAAASKMTAALGRGAPRDFSDVASLLQHYPRRLLLEMAYRRDPGLRPLEPAFAARRLDALRDADLAAGLRGRSPDVTGVRDAFASWPRDPAQDHEAAEAHERAQQPPPPARLDGPAPQP